MRNNTIITIKDGLGNRLFQFACGYSYSVDYKKKLIFCEEFYYKKNIHSDTDYKNIFFNDIDIIKKDNINDIINRFDLPNNLFCKYVSIPNIFNTILLNGYFQSYKYFQKYEKEIFIRYGCPIDKITYFQNEYDLLNGCFIHIRRGDYNNSKYDILLGTEYYRFCINNIKKKYINIKFYIFSNDLDYCKEYFNKYDNIYYIDKNEIDTLWMMQLCKLGGICANSSFSWWGGWLNKQYNNSSNIYFPSRLMNINMDYSDLYYPSFNIVNIDNI